MQFNAILSHFADHQENKQSYINLRARLVS